MAFAEGSSALYGQAGTRVRAGYREGLDFQRNSPDLFIKAFFDLQDSYIYIYFILSAAKTSACVLSISHFVGILF